MYEINAQFRLLIGLDLNNDNPYFENQINIILSNVIQKCSVFVLKNVGQYVC